MPKRIKAIDLVWEAQPAMAFLKGMAEKNGDVKFSDQIGEWLDNARELLNRREERNERRSD